MKGIVKMKKVCHSNSSVPYIQTHDKVHFQKMYPEINMEDKYILWIQFGFYWPFTQYGVSANIIITLNDGAKLKMPKLVLRHLYPNKNWWYLCMKNGRKQSDTGIVLSFDTFKAISSIKRIQCLWEINLDDNSDNTYNALIEYKTSFQESAGMRHYSINSHDSDIVTIDEAHEEGTGVFGSTFNEYSDIVNIKSDPDGTSFLSIKSQIDNFTDYELIKLFYASLNFESFFNSLISDNLFIVDYFMAEESLIPHPCSWL